jgi:hypothetical protein
MRYLSVIALVVVLGGLLLWVGLSDSDSTAAEGDALLLAGGPLAATATASPVPTAIADPVLSASVDFGKSSETVLDPCTLKVANGKLSVSAGGSTIGVFTLDGDGRMVPAGSQPNGNKIMAAYSGPPGDKFTSYKIFPSNYEKGSGVAPLLAIDHDNGNVSVKSAAELVKTGVKSDYNNRKNKYDGGTSVGGGCSTGGSGGGGGG